jgi:hypothetical protein
MPTHKTHTLPHKTTHHTLTPQTSPKLSHKHHTMCRRLTLDRVTSIEFKSENLKNVALKESKHVTAILCNTNHKKLTVYKAPRGGFSSTQDLGPTMPARSQSIGISIGMLPQTLIVSRLDQLSQLDATTPVFSLLIRFFPVC